MKIVITQPMGLTKTQLAGLRSMGEVTYYDSVVKDAAEWVERVKGADIIYSNRHGLEGWHEVRNAFITLPFVSVNFMDPAVLAANNVVVSRSPGCNQVAVSEWIVGMLLNYARRLPEFTSATHFDEPTPIYTESLAEKVVCVVGKGDIGSRAGRVLEALGAHVRYYTRHDDLATQLKGADFIVDTIGLNDSTIGFYDEAFFNHVQDSAVFISVTSNKTKDADVLMKQLDSGKLRHYITDNAQSGLFDSKDPAYRELLKHPHVTATPHIAAYTDNTRDTASRICIANIKAYLAGKPVNLVV